MGANAAIDFEKKDNCTLRFQENRLTTSGILKGKLALFDYNF